MPPNVELERCPATSSLDHLRQEPAKLHDSVGCVSFANADSALGAAPSSPSGSRGNSLKCPVGNSEPGYRSDSLNRLRFLTAAAEASGADGAGRREFSQPGNMTLQDIRAKCEADLRGRCIWEVPEMPESPQLARFGVGLQETRKNAALDDPAAAVLANEVPKFCERSTSTTSLYAMQDCAMQASPMPQVQAPLTQDTSAQSSPPSEEWVPETGQARLKRLGTIEYAALPPEAPEPDHARLARLGTVEYADLPPEPNSSEEDEAPLPSRITDEEAIKEVIDVEAGNPLQDDVELEYQSNVQHPVNGLFFDQSGEDTDGLRSLEDGLNSLITGFDQLHADVWVAPAESHGTVEVGLGMETPDAQWSPSLAPMERTQSDVVQDSQQAQTTEDHRDVRASMEESRFSDAQKAYQARISERTPHHQVRGSDPAVKARDIQTLNANVVELKRKEAEVNAEEQALRSRQAAVRSSRQTRTVAEPKARGKDLKPLSAELGQQRRKDADEREKRGFKDREVTEKSRPPLTSFSSETPNKFRERDFSNELRRRTAPPSVAQKSAQANTDAASARLPGGAASYGSTRFESPNRGEIARRREASASGTNPSRESPKRADSTRRKDVAPTNTQQRMGPRSQTRQGPSTAATRGS